MKNNSIRHIHILYGLFAGILIACIGLFFSNVFLFEQPSIVGRFTDAGREYEFRITALDANTGLYEREHSVTPLPDDITAHTHITRYDVDICTDAKTIGNDPRLVWVNVLQIFCIAAIIAIIVLTAVTLILFYRSAKRGRIFPAKRISLLVVIGFLLTFASLGLDFSTYLERSLAYDLLQHTEWQPQAHFTLHFTRIFFGLTLIFLAEVFRIGRRLQDEQELTI